MGAYLIIYPDEDSGGPGESFDTQEAALKVATTVARALFRVENIREPVQVQVFQVRRLVRNIFGKCDQTER